MYLSHKLNLCFRRDGQTAERHQSPNRYELTSVLFPSVCCENDVHVINDTQTRWWWTNRKVTVCRIRLCGSSNINEMLIHQTFGSYLLSCFSSQQIHHLTEDLSFTGENFQPKQLNVVPVFCFQLCRDDWATPKVWWRIYRQKIQVIKHPENNRMTEAAKSNQRSCLFKVSEK